MSDFFKKTGQLGFGLLLSGIAGLALNIGLGNILSGQQYGIFRIFFSAVLLTGWIFAFGIEREVTSKIANKNLDTAKEVGKSIIGVIFSSLIFLILGFVFKNQIQGVLELDALFLYFLGATIFFILYRYLIGILKGKKLMKEVGILNIIIGVLKLAIGALTFYIGWTALGVNISLTVMFLIMSLIPLYWIGDILMKARTLMPSPKYFKNIINSTTKQIGDVAVRFGGPLIVTILGGSSTDSGIFGAALTLSIVPYYGYQAVVQNMLPEVSDLKSRGDQKGINRRVSFLTESTLIFILLWSSIGYFVGPYIIRLIYQPSFIISASNTMLVFFIGGALLLSSMFTEVLIGLKAQHKVAKSWIIPAFISPVVLLETGPGITLTSHLLALYILLATIILGTNLFMTEVKFRFTGFDHTVFK